MATNAATTMAPQRPLTDHADSLYPHVHDTRCQRYIYRFACSCEYASPPCACLRPNEYEPYHYNWLQITKRKEFVWECPGCYDLGLEIALVLEELRPSAELRVSDKAKYRIVKAAYESAFCTDNGDHPNLDGWTRTFAVRAGDNHSTSTRS